MKIIDLFPLNPLSYWFQNQSWTTLKTLSDFSIRIRLSTQSRGWYDHSDDDEGARAQPIQVSPGPRDGGQKRRSTATRGHLRGVEQPSSAAGCGHYPKSAQSMRPDRES